MDNSIAFNENYRSWEDNDFIVKCFDKCSGVLLLSKQLHKIGTGKKDDNLSRHFYPIMLWNFIASYKNNRDYFCNEYDFYNPCASRINFDVIDDLLYKLKLSCDQNEFKEMISDLLKDETVCMWANSIEPKSRHEKTVKKAFLGNNEKQLISAYSRKKKEPVKNKHFIKRLIKKFIQR